MEKVYGAFEIIAKVKLGKFQELRVTEPKRRHHDRPSLHSSTVCDHCKKDPVRRDFPGSPVVKNSPSNAGDVGLIPGWGTKIPHAAGQLSPCAATREKAMRCNY